MSTDNASASNESGDIDAISSVTIDDPDDYNRHRRLRQVHEARERVPETIREEGERVSNNPTGGEITQARYREIVADALIEYLIELEPVMLDEDIEFGKEFWANKQVETDGQDQDITLKRIVEENGVVQDEDGSNVPLTIGVSRNAFRLANRFLNKIGFGLGVDEGMPTDKI